MLSLLIAGSTAMFTYRNWSDRQRQIFTEDLYETYESWNDIFLEEPYLYHLVVTPEQYREVVGQIETAVAAHSRDQLIRLTLAETVMADVIFDAYEEMLEDLHHAQLSDDEFRIGLISRALSRLEERVARNPRLYYLWRSFGIQGRTDEVIQRIHARLDSHDSDAGPAEDDRGPFHRTLERLESAAN